ncbi:NAD(P)H-dependent flavin oxidoreductase [uncultured Jatrophihabitans sp.]|uniref:NAD(P)H-dependent flavin oxidoreductase n=1 Tax=uncultured Jatrophihabitans sp. TaxID=1610747 RepID=UPI0035CCAA08
MTLSATIRDRLTLPAVCAPMYTVTGPELVHAACAAGVLGVLPFSNAGDENTFEQWLTEIDDALTELQEAEPRRRVAPTGVNLRMQLPAEVIERTLALCARRGVRVIITAGGDPADMAARVHEHGLEIWHDVTSLRFAEKAIAAGVDGLTCIGAGGGGHSGPIGHLVLVPRIRAMFDGTITMAGSVSTGAAIRAAEILGADLAYMGTRFIATEESRASADYKRLILEGTSSDLRFTADIAGVPANWMVESMRLAGLDPQALPTPTGSGRSYGHLPDTARPWKTVWSAGQGIDLIDDLPTVADLVARLRADYVTACRTPDMSDVAADPVVASRAQPAPLG